MQRTARRTALAVAAILFTGGGWLLAQQTQSHTAFLPFLRTFERAPIWDSVFTG